MQDQYFGIKELYEVVLKAKVPMTFGSRRLEVGEPVLYFENVNMALLSEKSSLIMARGGWSNLPRVIWEDRSEVSFTLSQGVTSSISLGILLSADMAEKTDNVSILIPQREGPFQLTNFTENDQTKTGFFIHNVPKIDMNHKVFIYEYMRQVGQKKVYGELKPELDRINPLTDEEEHCVFVYEDKQRTINGDTAKQYIIDYYYEYMDKAIFYNIKQDRFQGLFTLEGKFYSKDENEGKNYTNLIYMPKVRIVSDINLRLGERADPTVATFRIIGLPEKTNNSDNLIVEITRLNQDINSELEPLF